MNLFQFQFTSPSFPQDYPASFYCFYNLENDGVDAARGFVEETQRNSIEKLIIVRKTFQKRRSLLVFKIPIDLCELKEMTNLDK